MKERNDMVSNMPERDDMENYKEPERLESVCNDGLGNERIKKEGKLLTKEERYKNDPYFRTLVDTLVAQIEQMQTTPTEIREAAMFAQFIYETRHPERRVFYKELRRE